MAKQKAAKPEMVTLHNKATKKDQQFRIDEAQALLNHEKELGVENYVLPENSKFVLDDGELITRTSAKANQRAEKLEGDSQSETKEDQA